MVYLNLLNDVKKRLSFEGAAELDKFVASPAIKEIVERDEVRELEKRRALIAEMDALPAKSEKLQAAVVETARKAEARFLAARAELQAATEAHSAAFIHAYGVTVGANGDVYRIQKILGAGADPRLQHFADSVYWLRNSFVRHAVVTWPSEKRDWVDGSVTTFHASNLGEVHALMAVMQTAIDESKALQMAAISWADVTTFIRDWLARLKPDLIKLGIDFLTLDDDGNIKALKNDTAAKMLDAVVAKAGGSGMRVLK